MDAKPVELPQRRRDGSKSWIEVRRYARQTSDRWTIVTLVRDVTTAYETYDVTGATRPIEKFVENLSTWYLRRSRRRFWKSESDSDKQAAYSTLYTALVTLSKLFAPAMAR